MNLLTNLQKALAKSVFKYAVDKKKAAGRALGTLVEIITFYTLRAWGFRDSIAIERPLEEYANPEIKHNVEYSLHPILSSDQRTIASTRLPLSASKLRAEYYRGSLSGSNDPRKSTQLLSKNGILRNFCTVLEGPNGPLIAHYDDTSHEGVRVTFSQLHRDPFAIFECKRVGVEEGVRKGPQTIEKAKQGAYVARTISSLQKVRLRDGSMGGVIHRADGSLLCKPYETLLDEVIASDSAELLDGFILTVGVVSNHGNWFTSENHNKELRVLAQSYDWLLFLTDQGLSEFIDQLILNPAPLLTAAREAFQSSYTGTRGKNRFTKVCMDRDADAALQHYFEAEHHRIQGWFNIITPAKGTLETLHNKLTILSKKDWKRIKGL